MKKKILGIIAVVAVIFVNLYLTSSDNTIERLIFLQNVESLAEEEMEVDRYKELGSFLCQDGSYYQKCISVMNHDKFCLPSQETYCHVGTEVDSNVITPGNTDIITKSCSSLGHIWNISADFKWCSRCGLKIKI